MADARTEVLAAMSTYAQANSTGDLFCDHAGLLDAIPTAALVRLVIERGGLEQVGWQRPFGAQRVGPLFPLARKRGEHEDDVADSTLKPVYRIAEEPT